VVDFSDLLVLGTVVFSRWADDSNLDVSTDTSVIVDSTDTSVNVVSPIVVDDANVVTSVGVVVTKVDSSITVVVSGVPTLIAFQFNVPILHELELTDHESQTCYDEERIAQ